MKILRAWWLSTSEIAFVLNKDLEEIPEVELSGGEFSPKFSVSRGDKVEFSKYTSHFIDSGKIHFVLGDANYENFIRGRDYYVCGDFNGWGEAVGNPKWKMSRAPKGSWFDFELAADTADINARRDAGLFKFASAKDKWLEPRRDSPNIEFDKEDAANLMFSFERTGKHIFVIKLDSMCRFGRELNVILPKLGLSAPVDIGNLLLGVYSNARLGAHKRGGKTLFSIFAPRAEAVYVRVWREGEASEHLIEASSADGAVWTAEAQQDFEGAYYAYHIRGRNIDNSTDFNLEFPIADPYANAMLSSKGPAIVKYSEALPKAKNGFHTPAWHDLAIMEIHVRDILAKARADIGEGDRLTFNGLSKWLGSDKCYLRRVGVNCVELQPVQEFTAENRSDYEWGYMPVNWFSPSSSYAENPKLATQNADFAGLVEAFHKAGIAVILDVVYNHYGEPNHLLKADKEYYFETDRNFNLSNYSGCGNDFRASAPMSRRLILDSLRALVEHYGVDGFRFDLAELLGMNVLRDIEREMKKIKPSIILIAEPWSFRGHIAAALRDTGYASWNDGFREFILRYVLGRGDFKGLKYFMRASMGGTSSWPAQSVNYLDSHDDMCLLDRITSSHLNPSSEDLRRYKMGYAIVLLAHGIPMLPEGFDLVRTKFGKSNTYKDGETNAVDYMRGERFTGVRDWLRSVLAFRLGHSGRALRRYSPPSETFCKFYEGFPQNAAGVVFNADSSDPRAPEIFAAFNPSDEFADLAVGGDLAGFRLIADIDRFDIGGIESDFCSVCREIVTLPPLSFMLAVRD